MRLCGLIKESMYHIINWCVCLLIYRFFFREPTCINLNKIFGFILNVPSDYKISFITLPLRRRHWIALRRINNVYYNLDSKLDSPEIIGQVRYVLI